MGEFAHIKDDSSKIPNRSRSKFKASAADDVGSELRHRRAIPKRESGRSNHVYPVNVWDGKIVAGQAHTFYVTEGHTTLLVVLSGEGDF